MSAVTFILWNDPTFSYTSTTLPSVGRTLPLIYTNTWPSPLQPERCWAICLRCLLSGARTMSSTRASLSTRTSCSATTCRPLLHLEDIRHLQLSSSWLQDLTRCLLILFICYSCEMCAFVWNDLCYLVRAHRSTVWILKPLCRTPTLTSPGPAVLSQVYQQEPQSSPWQPTTYSLISKQRNLVSALKPCTNFFPSNYKRNTCYST